MQSLNELKPGRFLGRYELLMPVAQGGMAAVWAARLQGTRGFQKVVAIKTILPTLSDDPRFEQMFLDEAALASRIRHSNVAQVLDLGEDQGLLYQVMEWIEGPALNQLLRDAVAGKGLPRPIASKIMIGVCEGLHAAHEMTDDSGALVGLVHRDVSPQNVLVSIDGVPKVVDFGVAKATSLSNARTASGTFKGKPAYMAPEQILGGEVDRRADVFALGVVLYLITTGKHPFRGESDMATLHRMVDPRPPAKPSDVSQGYPSALESVVMKAIRKRADERFASAAEMARALQQAMPEAQSLGDTDVAACVRELSGAALKTRADALKTALAAADERNPPAGRTSSPSYSPGRQSTGIGSVPPSGSQVGSPSLTPSDGGTPNKPVSTTAEVAPSRSKVLPVVLGAGAVLGIAAVVGVLVARRAEPAPAFPPVVLETASAAVSASAAPSASASTTAPEDSSKVISAEALPRVLEPGSRDKVRPPVPSAEPSAKAPAKTPSKGYVPSIRDPGF